jgi:hypothetical protein
LCLFLTSPMNRHHHHCHLFLHWRRCEQCCHLFSLPLWGAWRDGCWSQTNRDCIKSVLMQNHAYLHEPCEKDAALISTTTQPSTPRWLSKHLLHQWNLKELFSFV